MADPKGLIDLVEAIAWPALFGGLAIGFRTPIKSFLGSFQSIAGRIKKAGPLEFESIGDQARAAGQVKPKEEEGKVLKTETDPSLRPWIENINEQIRRNNLNVSDLQEQLVQSLAWNLRHNEFNNTAKLIFGTQVAALKEISNSGGLSAEALQTIHAEHSERVIARGDIPLDFLKWIGFLRDRRLVVMDERGRYQIAPLGVAFLQYAASEQLTEARLF